MLKPAFWLRCAVSGLMVGFIFLVAACSSPQPIPATSPISTQIPSPASTPVDKQNVTLQSGLGGITGRLVAGSITGQPYMGGDIYLGRLISGTDPNAQPMVAFSNDSDPKAVANTTDGSFVFDNIQPGEYALVVWNPALSFVVESPKGNLIRVTVAKDKITDLGTIIIP